MMLVALIAAATAPAPKRPMQFHAMAAILGAMALMSSASIFAFTGFMTQDVILVMIGIGVLSGISSVWFGRGRPDGGGGGGSDDDHPKPTPPGPGGFSLNWENFDDHRSGWEEDQRPVGTISD